MKKFIYFFLFFLVSLAANSQVQRPANTPSPNSPTGYSLLGYSRADSGFIWGKRDTFPAKFPTIIWHTNGNFYKSNGNGGAWSIFASSTAGTVSSVSGNAPISVANGTTTPTISADTSYNGLATKKWLYKTVDSLGFIKLNISDTAAMLLSRLKVSDTAYMLSAYLRKSDTSAMLSNYVPISRTITTNAPLFGGGNLSANRTFGVDTGRANAQLVTGGSLTAVKDTLINLIASSGGGTVLSVATTNGVGIISSVATPSSTPNISIRADTLSLSTRWWRQKGIDSVQTNLTNGLALKLNLSDTAAMLSNRLKISDTAFMLMPFMQYSDTSFMLSPYRRTSTKITNSDLANSTISGISLGSNLAALTFGQYLQVGASSYNGSTATTITTNATSTNSGSTLVARDINGDFSARNISAALLGNASSASTVAITNDVTTNATYYPMFSTVTTGATSTRVSSSKLTYNPSTGMLSSTGFTGALTGNASTATVLQTPRTINRVSFDGSANITISASVDSSLTAGYGITGSPFDGSLARTWIIDTSNISTKANVTGALVAKLNIYDTAAMLSNRLKISDTANMLSNYRRKTTLIENADLRDSAITINGTSTALGGSISVGTVTSVSAGTGMSFTTITGSGAVNADTTVLSTRAYAAGLDVAKANTSLNNVNGVLSSTYGGAGSVSGILKANGSGVVSAAVAGDITSLISGTYLPLTAGSGQPLSGSLYANNQTAHIINQAGNGTDAKIWGIQNLSGSGNFRIRALNDAISDGINAIDISRTGISSVSIALGGSLSGTSLSMSGAGSFGSTITGNGNAIFQLSSSSVLNIGADQLMYGGSNSDGGVFVYGANKLHLSTNSSRRLTITDDGKVGIGTVSPAANFVVASGRTLLNGNTDNGTDALQVAGSGLFTGGTVVSNGAFYKATRNSGALVTEMIGIPSGSDNVRILTTGDLNVVNGSLTNLLTIANSGAATFSSSVTASSLIKSGGTSSQALIADGSVQTLTSGTYTPTTTGITNITSTTGNTGQYQRIGNIVTVTGRISITVTSNNTLSQVDINLPIASNFTDNANSSGIAVTQLGSSGSISGIIIAETTNDRVSFSFYPTSGAGSSIAYNYSFTYIVQ